MLRKRLVLGELELAILNVLWSEGEGTIQEVLDKLPTRLRRHYNTCSTVLDRLARRRIVTREMVGRVHRFKAVVSRDALARDYLSLLKRDFFGGSLTRFVSALVAPQKMRPAQLQRLEGLLAEREKEERRGS